MISAMPFLREKVVIRPDPIDHDASAGCGVPVYDTPDIGWHAPRPATMSDSERSCVQMATQINVLDAGTDAAMSLLVVLMAILAMLGIVANVAMA